MSLINEALKKAQKQRTQEPQGTATADSPSSPTPRVAKRSQPMPAQTMVIVGMLCLLLLVGIVAAAWFFFGNSTPSETLATPTTPPVKSATVAAEPAATAPVTPGSSAPADVPSPAASGLKESLPVVAVKVPAPATVVPTPTATPTPTPAPSAAATVANPASPGETPLHINLPAAPLPYVPPDAKIGAIVDALRVSGIRAAANDPKVLMNDRVYRLNDMVDRASGLRLLEITPSHLVFIDEAGATYIKNF